MRMPFAGPQETALPPGFNPETYLRLNPDVAEAGADPSQHYVEFGRSEGRRYREEEAAKQHLSDFASETPSDQAIVDIFQGEWSSAFPSGSGLVTKPGHAALFSDHRIDAAEKYLGTFEGKSVCELGPLEGGHTYMMHRRGAKSIDAVEANKEAFLKCLCVKEIFGLSRTRFLLGDAIKFLETTPKAYDVVFASGILYHMVDPTRLLRAITEKSDSVYIWTHYYDRDAISERDDRGLFQPEASLDPEGKYLGSKRLYPEAALSWSGFSGGSESYAVWMSRVSIERFLADRGFTEISVHFDDKNHPNGPSLAIAARRL